MNRTRVIIAAGAIACLCFSQAEAPQQNLDRLLGDSPMILGSDSAWMAQEPRVVHTGYVRSMIFGPGKDEAVIAARERITVTAEMFSNPSKGAVLRTIGDRLSVVNLSTGARRQINLPRADLTIRKLKWVSTRIVAATASTHDWQGVLLVDTLSGSSFSFKDGELHQAIASDVNHLALFNSGREEGGVMKSYLERVDFSVTPPVVRAIELPGSVPPWSLFTKDQTLICVENTGKVEMNLSTFATRPWVGETESLVRSETDSNWVIGAGRTRKLGAEVRRSKEGGLWISEDIRFSPRESGPQAQAPRMGLRPAARISKDADYAVMNEAGTRVLFRTLGAAFSLELTQVDLEAATQALLAAARTTALSWAKQAGLANTMYAADYDGFLPISGGQVQDSVMPYMADGTILSNMVWTNIFGQKLSDIKNPSSFELGYVSGPGGRAVLFADGSVKWRPTP